ncbi:MAG TPA: glycoside hydrolase family 3 N-terminal domain-containing protein [Ktedonobacteraceae bacterium]|nr:glycoside hydrolase family 3 N-terminal domain-containing protein [Ktedonobacteraceae bacterium]
MSVPMEQSQMPLPPARMLGNPVEGKGRLRRSGRHGWTKVPIMVVLACVMVTLFGGDIQQPKVLVPAKPLRQTVKPIGPFIEAPLSPNQVDKLHHLSAYLTDKQVADMYLSRMTLDQKLGQLFMVQYWGYSYSDDLQYMIHDQYVGGVIMYGAQMHTFKQTKDDISRMQKEARMPLLISSDEEGGFVQRIMNIYGDRPGALETYQTGKIENAAKLGHSIAHDLRALGINTDLAPDVDVPVVTGPDQYLRTWGYTPQSVITWGGTYLRAVQSDGEIACLKHFPGLGAASTDAHQDLPVVNRSQDELYSTELAPFKYFVQSHNKLENPGMIMTTDVLMPAIDPSMPGELSHTFVTDILRHKFGYNGVVITDALYMLGIAKKWSIPQAVVLAIEAGNDMILGVRDSGVLSDSIAALKQAIADGDLAVARINQSVERIITLKIRYHIWPRIPQL